MGTIDYAIIFVYLGAMIFVGALFQRKASSGVDEYFLGGKKIPWWALGASGMSSNFDVSGTMINTALVYALGAAGFFIEIRGGMVLTMAFFLAFMGKWNRRSRAMTMAEWMRLRFGDGREGKIAQLLCAVAVLLTTVGIVAYFAVGGGKFVGEFLGVPALFGLPSRFWAAALMIALAMIYTVASGLRGVVWTDVFQGVLIFATIVIVCGIAFATVDLPAAFDVSVPLRDGGYREIQTTAAEWTDLAPSWTLDVPEDSSYAIYHLFGLSILFYLIKTFVEGAGGTGGYMAQRFFAARSDREAGLISMFWISLLSFRWPFVVAIAMMAIMIGVESGAAIQDPEAALPIVVNTVVPVGLRGLLVAGLTAAAMSTFDSIVNSGASYWVRDVYQSFLKPDADERRLVRQSRVSSVVIVAVGLVSTLWIESVNEIWMWLTMSMGAGLVVPLLVRWYWERLNGYGFATGVAAGMAAAIGQKLWYADAPEYASFLLAGGASFAGCLVGSALTARTPSEVIDKFYAITRPFGVWRGARSRIGEERVAQIAAENRRDLLSLAFALPWQITIFMVGMAFMLKRWDYFAGLGALFLALSAGLYFFWYRRLSDE